MGNVYTWFSMSLDGFIAWPDDDVQLGAGVRLFDHLGTEPIELERTRVIEAPGVTRLRFRDDRSFARRLAHPAVCQQAM